MKYLAIGALTLISVVSTLVFFEGVHSLILMDRPHLSFLFSRIRSFQVARTETPPRGETGANSAFSRGAYLQDRKELERLIPDLKKIEAGVGNTDFFELQTENASINYRLRDSGCEAMKPDLAVQMFQLRTTLFFPWDPPVVFFQPASLETSPSPALMTFLERYSFRQAWLHTNSEGERRTLPEVKAKKVALIAGDSVALGLSISDAETLASRLQGMDAERQYVNLGISGADTETVQCALERAAERYAGRIDELVYVVCDNDYNSESAVAIAAKISEFQQKNRIGRVSIVRAPYTHALFPMDDWGPGSRAALYGKQAFDLAQESARLGFRFLDVRALAESENESRGTMFGFFPLFIDYVHWSAYGTRRVAEALAISPSEKGSAAAANSY